MRVALTHDLRRSSGEDDAELDTPETIATIAAILGGLGHAVVPIEVSGPVPALVARLERAAPDLVFNLAEGRRGRYREAFYPALYEQLGLCWTGSGAGALAIAMDKALTKRLVAAAGVATPTAVLVREPHDRGGLPRVPLPAIVKPNWEGSSKGITQASVVADRDALAAAVARTLAAYPAGVLVESYVAGADVAVAWVDGLSPATGGILPAASYRYAGGGHPILDRARKRSTGVHAVVPAPLPPAVLAALGSATARVIAALGIDGFARADFRVTAGGEVWFLEVNPLPSLAFGTDAEMYLAAAAVGASPADLLAAIVDRAPQRA